MAPVQEQMVPLNCPPGNQMPNTRSNPGNVPIGWNGIKMALKWLIVLDLTLCINVEIFFLQAWSI